MRVFSVFDGKAAIYSTPIFQHTDAMASRAFLDACSDKETPVGRHPEDYTLYYIGEWDEFLGKLTGGPPRAVVTGVGQVRVRDGSKMVEES